MTVPQSTNVCEALFFLMHAVHVAHGLWFAGPGCNSRSELQNLGECALLVSLSRLHFNWRHSPLGGESVLLSEVPWAPGEVTDSYSADFQAEPPASGPVCAGHGVQRGHQVAFFPEVPSPSPHSALATREADLPTSRRRISCVLRSQGAHQCRGPGKPPASQTALFHVSFFNLNIFMSFFVRVQRV